MLEQRHHLVATIHMSPNAPQEQTLQSELVSLIGLAGEAKVERWRLRNRVAQAWLLFSDEASLHLSLQLVGHCFWNDYGVLSLRRVPDDGDPKADSGSEREVPRQRRPRDRTLSSTSGLDFSPHSLRPSECSPVLHLKHIAELLISARHLWTLFSTFGPVKKVLVMRNLRKAVLEFAELKGAVAAFEFFSRIEDELFQICYSYHSSVQIPLKLGKHNEFFEPASLSFKTTRHPPTNTVAFVPSPNTSPASVLQSIRLVCPRFHVVRPEPVQPEAVCVRFDTLTDAVHVFCELQSPGAHDEYTSVFFVRDH